MSERTIYQPGVSQPERRREWVELPAGWVCVWELTVADSAQILERSQRPDGDPRDGPDKTRAMAAQIMLSCFDNDGPPAQRIFGDADYAAIYMMPFREYDLLIQAINRVNGKSAEEQAALKDFTTATEAQNPSASPTGA